MPNSAAFHGWLNQQHSVFQAVRAQDLPVRTNPPKPKKKLEPAEEPGWLGLKSVLRSARNRGEDEAEFRGVRWRRIANIDENHWFSEKGELVTIRGKGQRRKWMAKSDSPTAKRCTIQGAHHYQHQLLTIVWGIKPDAK